MIKGSIKAYSPSVNAGIIETTDGQRYQFSRNHWTGKNPPQANDLVTFEMKGANIHIVRSIETA